ncbi:MAG: hypothetical protein HZB79_12555, partial [Deltaproteobacteria bacterium]|nr:hypothetical protein [Deltaproteobacteria bacterium]
MKTFSPLKIIFLLSIFMLSLTSISDTDAFTHLSLGREIIKTLGFPLTEQFNHTSLDKPFGYPEWLFGVIIYSVYLILGSAGVVIFKAGVITFTYFILFKDSELQTMSSQAEFLTGSDKSDPYKNCRGLIYQARYLIAVIFLFLIAIFARGRFVERPEILSNLFLVFTIFSLNQFFYNGRRYIYFIPLVFILWANTHPSIIIGLYPFIAFIIGGAIQSFFNKYEHQQWNRLKIITLILFASILCTLINPYTYNILFAPKGLAANIWRYEVVELAPANWEAYKPLYIFIGIIFVSFIFNLRQSIINIILILPFVAISTSAIRFIPLIGIIGAPIVVRNISNLKFQISNFKLLLLKIFVSIYIVILTIATLANIGPFKNYENTFGISINASSLPEGALEYLHKNNIQGRIFNTFHFGGYITFK